MSGGYGRLVLGPPFEGRLDAGPGGGAFVVVPPEVLAALGGGVRFRVKGEIDGVGFASSTMAMGGGDVCVGVHKATRRAAAVDIGAVVVLRLERDTSARTLDLPAELASAFAGDDAARATFEGLSFTRRREYVDAITGAEREATRARRVARILAQLRATSPGAHCDRP